MYLIGALLCREVTTEWKLKVCTAVLRPKFEQGKPRLFSVRLVANRNWQHILTFAAGKLLQYVYLLINDSPYFMALN